MFAQSFFVDADVPEDPGSRVTFPRPSGSVKARHASVMDVPHVTATRTTRPSSPTGAAS
jgi:hypothetical protein